MKKFLLATAVLALLGISATVTVLAQPPEDDRPPRGDRLDGPPLGERRGEGGPNDSGRPPMPNPLVAALDKNGDREISAEELEAATASLLTLDKNKDGKLTDDEMRPPRPEGGQGFGRGDGPPGHENPGRGDGPPGREGGGPSGGPSGGPRGGGPMGPPNPERLVEHAMGFDADGDGKLDKAEMTKFAEEFTSRMGRFGRPDGEGRPSGERSEGGPPRRRDRGQEGERPKRPAEE